LLCSENNKRLSSSGDALGDVLSPLPAPPSALPVIDRAISFPSASGLTRGYSSHSAE